MTESGLRIFWLTQTSNYGPFGFAQGKHSLREVWGTDCIRMRSEN